VIASGVPKIGARTSAITAAGTTAFLIADFINSSSWAYRGPTKSSPKVAEGGAQLATATSKRPTCGPTPEQRLEVQRLVLLRLHAVVRSHPQNPGRSGGCRRRSAKALAHQRATRCYAQVPWRCG
jgi:hypothetical protein